MLVKKIYVVRIPEERESAFLMTMVALEGDYFAIGDL